MGNVEKQNTDSKSGAVNRVFTVVGVILCVILLPVLCINIWLLIQGYSGDGIPNIGGYYPLIVQSGSMEPAIRTGDLIFNRTAEIEDIEVGDVVSYYEGDYIITHRVIETATDSSGERVLTCKGDANNAADETPVTKENLAGIYLNRIPGLGDVAMFMQTTKGMIICVLCPVVIWFVYDMLQRKRYEKAERREADELRAELERLKAEKADMQGNNNS